MTFFPSAAELERCAKSRELEEGGIGSEYDDETLEILKEEAGEYDGRAAKLTERRVFQMIGSRPTFGDAASSTTSTSTAVAGDRVGLLNRGSDFESVGQSSDGIGSSVPATAGARQAVAAKVPEAHRGTEASQ